MHKFSFSGAEQAVKSGCESHHVDILHLYIYLGIERAKACETAQQTKAVHLHIINTLKETMCDDCLSLKWRTSCYRWLKKMMPLLYELVSQTSYCQEVANIKLLHDYFINNKQPLTLRDSNSIVAQQVRNYR